MKCYNPQVTKGDYVKRAINTVLSWTNLFPQTFALVLVAFHTHLFQRCSKASRPTKDEMVLKSLNFSHDDFLAFFLAVNGLPCSYFFSSSNYWLPTHLFINHCRRVFWRQRSKHCYTGTFTKKFWWSISASEENLNGRHYVNHDFEDFTHISSMQESVSCFPLGKTPG